MNTLRAADWLLAIQPRQQRRFTLHVVGSIEKVPSDFDFGLTGQGALGQWVVTRDPSATGGRAIQQTSTDRTDYRFPLAIYKLLSAANVDVSVRFKAVAGSIDQAGGIALRLVDPNNYYVVRANALEDNVPCVQRPTHRDCRR